MRDLISIVEAFDTSQEWKWHRQDPDNWIAIFEIGDLPYHVIFDGFNAVTVKFCAITRDENGSGPHYGVTGTGSANKVFGTVLDILRAFVSERHPRSFEFDARKSQSSRVRLYRKIVSMMGNVPGYSFEEDGADHPRRDSVRFVFTRQ